jgi:hypothetical protein
MDATLIQLLLFALGEAVKMCPQLKSDIQAILAKDNPTPADWAALRAKIAASDYFTYVPASSLPR